MFFRAVSTDYTEKNIFLPIFGPIFSRSAPPFWSHGALSDAPGEAFGWFGVPSLWGNAQQETLLPEGGAGGSK